MTPCPVCSDPDCQSWALRKNETWHTPPPPRPKPGTSERDPLLAHHAARRLRETELRNAGATRTQAYAMALEEAWRDAVLENERLWDQEPGATA